MILAANVKTMFLDRQAVIRRTDRAQRRALNRAGGLTRTIARRSMRKYSGRASRQGEPPKYREGSLRRLLFYAFDPAAESVIVGPVGFGRSELPLVLEQGGLVTVTSRRDRKRKTKRIEARPYMVPALDRAAPELPEIFGQSLRREFA